ncbi:MAG: hypothetical protein H0V01_01990 [Bacteroidetes bacterium]|nr:hypothetical protein [Bacteroidota bacterium]HET6243314.1 hypothetical protein [Bacteroidia bacterium]
MNFFSKIHFLPLLLLVISLTGCMKKVDYPNEPIVKFKEFVRFNNDSAWFVFSFTDGDGDIGLKSSDIDKPFHIEGEHYYNFYMDYYEKQNGEFVKITLAIPFSYRIPYITPEGKNKSLQGEILVRIPFEYMDSSSPYDTIKYAAFIYDRTLNKSNTIETPEIVVQK